MSARRAKFGLLPALGSWEILHALHDWTAAETGRGEVFIPINVLMDEHNMFGPDISYLREDRVPTEDVHHVDGPPDLAVEVRSSSTWLYNVGKKMRSYERLGLPELWLVDIFAQVRP